MSGVNSLKVKIENFGPVKSFEFDSEKSMHLIVGTNNVGKSYALAAYYFAVKSLIEFTAMATRNYYLHDFVDEPDRFDKRQAEDLFAKLKEKKNKDIDVSHIYAEAGRVFVRQTLADIFSQRIKSSFAEFDSVANQFADCKTSRIQFTLPLVDIVLEGDVDGFTVAKLEFGMKVNLRTIKQNRAPTMQGGTYIIYRNTADKSEDSLHKVRYTALRMIITSVAVALRGIAGISYLPASRSGLYQALSAFGLIVAELSKNRSFISSRIELPGISGQLSDYFINLAGITEGSLTKDESFEELAKKIEATVLKGKIEYDFDRKRLFYCPENTSLKLDLSATSSMVSEVAPIVAYIRYIISNKVDALRRNKRFNIPDEAKPLKQILIIEEPEAHLHPENQIRMMDLYADLSKLDVNVILTSHSNYVFNKLGNLLLSGDLEPAAVRCDLFNLTPEGSVGVAQNVDDFGIDDSNFVDASEALLNEKLSLMSEKEIQID